MDTRSPERIRQLVIVGGGTAGWMAAAALARHFERTDLRITLVESSAIGTIGVGEATIPTIRRFYARLGMSDMEVMRATHATAKLGISFEGWDHPGSRCLHPFGLFGQDYGEIGFHHLWLDAWARGDETPLTAYSLGAGLANEGRMALPQPNPPTPLATYDWALHLDASLFAQHLRGFAERAGVTRIDARVEHVELAADGRIAAIRLDEGRRVAGDFFIDCTGFRSLLLGEALGVDYVDWGQWLPCDTAIAIQTENDPATPLPPHTRVIARDAGWQWRIPLQHRAGNGIVYASEHWSDDEALAALTADLPGKAVTEPRRIPFRPGRRAKSWEKNCVALGLAAGFVEPLESTSIAVIETGIERLKQLFPDTRLDPALASEFNDATGREMDRLRDFLVLHYKLARRGDTPFWRACAAIDLPETLRHKLAVWDACGEFVRYRWEMFHPSSWLAIYSGFGRLPQRLSPALDGIDRTALDAAMAKMRTSVAETVVRTPSHAQFLAAIPQ